MKNILVILLLIITTPVFSQQSGSYSAGEGFILKEQNSIFFPSKRDRYLYWPSGEDERFDAPRSTIIFKETIFKDSYNSEIFWLLKKKHFIPLFTKYLLMI